MDCPKCGLAMLDQATEDGSGTSGWLCVEHGYFPVLCSCGYIDGQGHDVMCSKAA